jgi:hypothetical protein
MMAHLVGMFAGGIVWAAHFLVLYAYTAFACARGITQALPLVLGGATFAALAAVTAIIVRAYPQRAHFVAWMTIALGALAAVAIFFGTLAFTMVPACR